MRFGSLLFVLVVLFIAVAVDAKGQGARKDETAELLRLDKQWQDAVVTGDVGFIEKRTADDFVFTHGGGTKVDTREYVHLYARRKGQWMFLSHRTTQGIGAPHPCTESESK